MTAQIEQDTVAGTSKIIIEHADNFRAVTRGDSLIRYLNGDVRLFQDSTFMYCDSAILLDNELTAFGNVIIVQNDSVNVFADSLIYDGNQKIARLFNDVILQSNDQQLFTDFLIYDLNTKIGSYTEGALLKNEGSEIKSLIGRYFVNEEEVRFYEKVSIKNEDFQLWTDSLRYDSKNDIAHFLAPTRIDQEDSKIYCEDGFYDIANEEAEFRVNAQYTQDKKKATGNLIKYSAKNKIVILAGNANYLEDDKNAKGDTIIYYEETEQTELIGNAFYKDKNREVAGERISYNAKTESFDSQGRSVIQDSTTVLIADNVRFEEENDLGFANGKVILEDTASMTTIFSDSMVYKRDANYSKAYNEEAGRPMLQTIMDGDSLFMKADTLISEEITDSFVTTSFLNAFNNVKLYKSNLQAMADSMSYNTTDSIISMYRSPVIWSDSTQFTADTIDIYLKNQEIHKVDLKQNGFIINTSDSVFFNQIKGKLIEVFFVDGEIDSMSVSGNAESIYFMTDEDEAYIGMNKSLCSKMSFTFSENELKDIYFHINVSSNLIPIQDVNPGERLDGFKWNDLDRPKNKNEL